MRKLRRSEAVGLFVSAAIIAGGQTATAQVLDADALAKVLSNPGGAMATLNNKFEVRVFDGDLPGADGETNLIYTFQPVLPFSLDNGDTLIFRPAIPVLLHQPFFDPATGAFADGAGLGDIAFDLLYSTSTDTGWTFGGGAVGGIPTGTDSNIRSGNWLLGPEALVVRTFDWGVAGALAFHNWDVAGWGSDFSTTSFQYFLFYGLGNGWQIGTGPTISYNWEAPGGNEWTVPFGVTLAKTTQIGGKPIKFNASIEYAAIRPDSFGPEWKFTFTVSPVVKNPFDR